MAFGGQEARFSGRLIHPSTLQAVRLHARELKRRDRHRPNGEPLLVVTYISPSISDFLLEKEVSALDLNGNYLILTDGLVAVRMDKKNELRRADNIQKVFQGTSSLVPRFLLVEPGPHATITSIHEAIEARHGRISLSTVSKVLSRLDEELLIDKGEAVRLRQPETLLDRLRASYRPPRLRDAVRLDLPGDLGEQARVLGDALGGVPWVWSGTTSAAHHAATTPPRVAEAYARDLPVEALAPLCDDRFYSCVLHLVRDDYVYFDRDGPWASALETYLALMQGDKREREVAGSIERRLVEQAVRRMP
jgi:hypothetical protein